MPWLTNKKTGAKFNTDWLKDDEKKKYREIDTSKKMASILSEDPLLNDDADDDFDMDYTMDATGQVVYEENTDLPKQRARVMEMELRNLKAWGITPHSIGKPWASPVNPNEETKISDDEWIFRFGKNDETKGSCASAVLCYIGNKMGYQWLRDFQGGKSQEYFSKRINTILEALPGAKYYRMTGSNSDYVRRKLLPKMKMGKEYILSTGSHISIVKKIPRNGSPTIENFQYLELQTNEPGWKSLYTETLDARFGCWKQKDATSLLVDVDSLLNEKYIPEFLSYINTVDR